METNLAVLHFYFFPRRKITMLNRFLGLGLSAVLVGTVASFATPGVARITDQTPIPPKTQFFNVKPVPIGTTEQKWFKVYSGFSHNGTSNSIEFSTINVGSDPQNRIEWKGLKVCRVGIRVEGVYPGFRFQSPTRWGPVTFTIQGYHQTTFALPCEDLPKTTFTLVPLEWD